jgi:hypothetical protein
MGHEHDCENCKGEGCTSAPTEYSKDAFPCPGCGGTGGFDKTPTIPLRLGADGHADISTIYAAKLATLPGLLISFATDGMTEIPFVFDGGNGFLMPVRIKGAPR